MTLTTEDFDYNLPHELIAQTPIETRDASRLLVLDHKTGAMQDKHFYDIIDELHAGDAVVMNDSRVMPAEFTGQKTIRAVMLKSYCSIIPRVMCGKP